MKFSIVTISYNQDAYLRQCIESVIGQSHSDVEYIVVDPGSSDESRDIVRSYGAKIAKVVFEPDEGPADGLNAGFAHAAGDILGFVNSDDYLLPGALARVAQAFERRPDTDVVSGNAVVVDEHGKQINRLVSRRFGLRQHVRGAATLAQPSTFFRRSAFVAAAGFNADNRTNWDGELWIDLALSGARFRRISDNLSAFRIHSDSITGGGALAEKSARYRERMFERVMGRAQRRRDVAMLVASKVVEYATHPSVARARLRWGPVVRRGSLL